MIKVLICFVGIILVWIGGIISGIASTDDEDSKPMEIFAFLLFSAGIFIVTSVLRYMDRQIEKHDEPIIYTAGQIDYIDKIEKNDKIVSYDIYFNDGQELHFNFETEENE